MSAETQEVKLPESAKLVAELAAINDQREKAMEVAREGAALSVHILLDASMPETDHSDTREFREDVWALAEVFPKLQKARHSVSLAATEQEYLGPIAITEGIRSVDHYIGGLVIASQALEQPIVAVTNAVNVRIEPETTREEAIHDYHIGYNRYHKPL